MYESIPNELRTMEAGSKRMEPYKRGLLHRAAKAIEELSMRLHGDEAAIVGMKREIERMVVEGNHMKNCTGIRCIMQVGTVDPENCGAVEYCPWATSPKTKLDILRVMTDEDLAEWLNQMETDAQYYGPKGKAAWLEWLRQG